MYEIEYKLKSNNSVLVVNAVDKLISTIKEKYKPGERQRFVLENEELKFLREKCSAVEPLVSQTACQGLLALVELGVLDIGHTMSTVVTLLPSTHNYSAVISTMAGLLILDLKARLEPGQKYRCQFSLRAPQHPFITVLEKNKEVEDEVLVQMQALCTHPDYTVASNSLELLRPVFLWLAYNPQRNSRSTRPWRLLLSLPESPEQSNLLLTCISGQQICNVNLVENAFGGISSVVDAMIYQQKDEHVMAFLPVLARVSRELIKAGRDPRCCYNLIERSFALESPALKNVAGFTLMLLADNLPATSALHLHELFNLCLSIIGMYDCTQLCVNAFVGLALPWLNMPTYLTAKALQQISRFVEQYQEETKESTGLPMANLRSNPVYQRLRTIDGRLFTVAKILEVYEVIQDDDVMLEKWFDGLVKNNLQLDLMPVLVGFVMLKQGKERLMAKAIKVLIDLVQEKKDASACVLPVLVYKLANDVRPAVKLQCLRGLPLLATAKENIPHIMKILNKLKNEKAVPCSFLIMLYTSLAETQERCFPYLQEVLSDPGPGRPNEVKWEVELAKAVAVQRICEMRPSTHGLELVPVISSLLNRCTDKAGAGAARAALGALAALWRGAAVAPPGTWRALEPRLGNDGRPQVQIGLCNLLAEVPGLRVSSPEYDKLVTDAARRLWRYVAEACPEVVEAACDALARYKIEDYTLKDVPEKYRRTVKLPSSYCKTPADAARKPEDVLDYVPCEVWPEVFKHTSEDALGGVQRLVTALVSREVGALRGGAYALEGKGEPHSLAHLPHASVLRGVVECFRKQLTNPSYDFPEAALSSLLEVVTARYTRPLPPLDLWFAHEALRRGARWRAGCVHLAARQAQVSPSAKRLLEGFLRDLVAEGAREADVMLFFEYLPVLCRGVSPNTLRPALDACLADSFAAASRAGNVPPEELTLVKQLLRIKECLETDSIHDANRTLLSQIVENYFSIIPHESVVWPTFIEVCKPLASSYLERMTSPTSWWEVTAELVRKSTSVRSALAAGPGSAPLVWLNESIDAHAAQLMEREFSLQCFVPALEAAADRTDDSTRTWLLQLMARTQVAFNDATESVKEYLFDVFCVSVVVFSRMSRCASLGGRLATARADRLACVPPAAHLLLGLRGWGDCTLPMLEWLCHTRDSTFDPELAQCCQQTLYALRHTPEFTAHKIWTRMDYDFGRRAVTTTD